MCVLLLTTLYDGQKQELPVSTVVTDLSKQPHLPLESRFEIDVFSCVFTTIVKYCCTQTSRIII